MCFRKTIKVKIEQQRDWRYEIKYVLTPDQWFQIEQLLSVHPAGFSEAFPDRIVNNIYYDTPDFSTCRDNLAGISQRKKYRLRWYGSENKIINPIFEIKIKNNALGRKDFLILEDYTKIGEINSRINNKLIGLSGIGPVLQNQYIRSYYINFEGDFRLTVDRKIKYQKSNDQKMLNGDFPFHDDRIILELKFKAQDIKKQHEITKYIPFRNSKNSKYVTGIFYCY